jgi:hypothetical protein
MEVIGTVLEDGEAHDGPMTDLVDIAPIPQPRQTDTPLDVPPAFDSSSLETSEEELNESTARSERLGQNLSRDQPSPPNNPLIDSRSAPGQTGTLYADPKEDGDYSAFGDYIDDL